MTAMQARGGTGFSARLRAARHLPALLRLAWESGRHVVCAQLTCRIAAALVPIAMLAVAKQIFDALQLRTTQGILRDDFWWLVAIECGLAVTGAVLGRGIGFLDALFADRFARYVSVRVMAHAARLDLATYEDPRFHDALERARVQATDRIAMVHAIGTLVQQVIVAATLAAGIVAFSPWLLVLLVAAVFVAVAGESHFAVRGYSLSLQQTPVRRQLDYLRVLGASKESAKELKLFGLAPFLTGEYQRLSDEIYGQNLRLARTRLLAGSGLAVLTTGTYYGAYAYVIMRTVAGDVSWGTLQFVAGAIAGVSAAMQSAFATGASIADQSLFLTDLVTFLKLEPRIASPSHPVPVPHPIRDGVYFDRVSFAYPGTGRAVLDSLSLRIAPGERLALVGDNGQGKTTLVKLLTRLYDPTAGRILLDGIDLRDLDLAGLHRAIGVIFQDFVRFDMTARQNIAVGRIERTAADEEIELAARKSLANAVVSRLPLGYDQILGRRFDGGVDLSGGEWQKVALARAYLRDAQLLVLDEPTAALDARSEHDVFQRFADLTAGKMALLISHRFSTVRMADRIVVLANGRVAEQGTHRELMTTRGSYAEMFELQASSYR